MRSIAAPIKAGVLLVRSFRKKRLLCIELLLSCIY